MLIGVNNQRSVAVQTSIAKKQVRVLSVDSWTLLRLPLCGTSVCEC